MLQQRTIQRWRSIRTFYEAFKTGEPLMIIDIHTHMFPPDICNNRQNYFKNEPEFRLLYDSPKSALIGATELIRSMDDQGVDMSVVFGFPWNNLETSKFQNDYIMKMADAHPDRLIGFCCLNPAHPEAAREVERCIRGGIKGVGELAFYQSGLDLQTLEALSPVMALCEKSGLPVLIHTNEPVGHLYPGKAPMTLSEIYRMVRRFPNNTLVLAHWGGGLFFYHLMKKEVKDAMSHVYVDTAASPYLYDIGIYPVAGAAFGYDRILMGSDFPLLKPSRYITDMKKAGVPDDAIAAVSGGNAAKLLGIPAGH